LMLRNRKKLKKSDGKKSKHNIKGGMGEQRISEQTK